MTEPTVINKDKIHNFPVDMSLRYGFRIPSFWLLVDAIYGRMYSTAPPLISQLIEKADGGCNLKPYSKTPTNILFFRIGHLFRYYGFYFYSLLSALTGLFRHFFGSQQFLSTKPKDRPFLTYSEHRNLDHETPGHKMFGPT